jgi:hypothetical protein
MFVLKVCKSFSDNDVEFAIVGGWAVALHGAVRGTIDLDLVLSLSERNLRQAQKALNDIGLVSKIPVTSDDIFRFRKEYITKKNLIAWSFYSPKDPSEVVDLIITYDKKNIPIKWKSIGGIKVPVLAKTELIKMKKQSAREQDLEDIKALEAIDEKD